LHARALDLDGYLLPAKGDCAMNLPEARRREWPRFELPKERIWPPAQFVLDNRLGDLTCEWRKLVIELRQNIHVG